MYAFVFLRFPDDSQMPPDVGIIEHGKELGESKTVTGIAALKAQRRNMSFLLDVNQLPSRSISGSFVEMQNLRLILDLRR